MGLTPCPKCGAASYEYGFSLIEGAAKLLDGLGKPIFSQRAAYGAGRNIATKCRHETDYLCSRAGSVK